MLEDNLELVHDCLFLCTYFLSDHSVMHLFDAIQGAAEQSA
jgi:hypothetical protein